MASYTFENKDTGEEFTLQMKDVEREQYLKDNPHIQQILTTMTVVDPAGIGVSRPPADFQKYVVGKALQQPGAHDPIINRRWHIPREH